MIYTGIGEDKFVLPEPGDLLIFKSEGFLGKTISNYPNLKTLSEGLGIPIYSGKSGIAMGHINKKMLRAEF